MAGVFYNKPILRLKIGTTIGIALYFSQTISVAFYIVAFTGI